MRRASFAAAFGLWWVALGSCTAASSGEGGGGTTDPRVANISRSINDVLTCMNTSTTQTDQQTLAELQATYGMIAAPMQSFDAFVGTAETAFADIQSTCMPIQTITAAQNRALECTGVDTRLTTVQNFRDLRSGFLRSPGLMMSFSAVVAEFETAETMKADEICAAQLGADPELDALLARLTASANRRAVCINSQVRVMDADTLQVLQTEYFVSAVNQTFIEFAQQYVQNHEAATEQRCNP
jgi:hypothetical protein